jgi:four helix bundle protein
MAKAAFETLEIYQLSENLADFIWDMVLGLDKFARDAVGLQIARSADSIGANIAEGFGRGTSLDQRRFLRNSRGSLNETTHFLRRLYRRKLLSDKQIATLKPLMEALGPKLNAYINSLTRRLRAQPKRRPNRQTGTTNNKPQTTND